MSNGYSDVVNRMTDNTMVNK